MESSLVELKFLKSIYKDWLIDFISITNNIYVVKKGVKNDAHDTKDDKSVTNMA